MFHQAKYIAHYENFVATELEIADETKALTDARDLLSDPQLTSDVKFIANSASMLVELLTWFKTRDVLVHKAYNRVHDLLA